MRPLIRTPPTVAWLVLMSATLLSAWVGRGHVASGDVRKIGTVVVLSVALAKVHIVGMHFMELSGAPAPLRYVFRAWTVVTLLALICIYLLAG